MTSAATGLNIFTTIEIFLPMITHLGQVFVLQRVRLLQTVRPAPARPQVHAGAVKAPVTRVPRVPDIPRVPAQLEPHARRLRVQEELLVPVANQLAWRILFLVTAWHKKLHPMIWC